MLVPRLQNEPTLDHVAYVHGGEPRVLKSLFGEQPKQNVNFEL